MEDQNYSNSKYEDLRNGDKKLYRTRYNKKICGVANGFSEYLELDVKLIRILLLLSALFLPFIFFLYIVSAFMLPVKEKHQI